MQEDANTQQPTDEIVMPGQLNDSQEVVVDSDSSTDSGENHEKESNGFQDRINKVTADKYAEQRRANELQKQLDELKANQNSASAAQAIVESELKAPDMPEDIFDEEAMRKYHAETSDYNRKVASSEAKAALESQQQNQLKKQQEQQQQEVINTYASNALRDGVDIEKLQVAENTVMNAGISGELANYLLSEPNGGKIVEFLHDNPETLHDLAKMDPISAGIKIQNEIKPVVTSSTSNVSNAPAPHAEIRGGGVHEQDDFEKNYPGVEFI
jgi:hypothetical protein